MSVKIRFSRIGTTHSPVYRIVAVDSREKRDSGNVLENLGTYNPLSHKLEQWHTDRIAHWVSVGAQKSEAVLRLEKMVKKGSLKLPVAPTKKAPTTKKVEEAKA